MKRTPVIFLCLAALIGLGGVGCGGDDGAAPEQPSQTWVRSEGGTVSEQGLGITTDAAGNIIVTGRFSGRPTFGGTVLSSGGGTDMFVAKYDPFGTMVWVRTAGGPDTLAGWGVATDAAGNIYVTGYYQGRPIFGATTLTNAGGEDIFLAAYDANGNLQWAKSAGGSGIDRARGITTDGSGNIIIGGRYQGTAMFGGTTLNSVGAEDIVVARYDGSGTVVRATSAGGLGNDRCWGVAVAGDGSNDVVMTGSFADSAMFDGVMVRGAGGSDMFVARYNSAGAGQWVRAGGGGGPDTGWDIVTDGADAYVVGSFSGPATIGSTPLPGAGAQDLFVARYTSGGGFAWARSAGGVNDDSGIGIGVDGSHSVIITGFFESTASFSGTALTAAGSRDGYIAKYSLLGVLQWVQPVTGSGSNLGLDVTAQPSGYIIGTGSYQNIATFGNVSVTAQGLDDVFIFKAGAGGFN